MVTESGDFVILAVQRQGEDLDREPTALMVGDTLLLQGTWDALDRASTPIGMSSSSTPRPWFAARRWLSGPAPGGQS